MANTEKASKESAPVQTAVPTVTVNAPTNNESTSKANPNMLMALVLCLLLIIGLALAFYFKGEEGGDDKDQLTEKEKLQRLIDAERGGVSPDSRVSAAALESRLSAILENTHAIQSEFEVMKAGYTDAQEKLTRAGNEVQGNMNTISRLGSENTNLKSQIAQLQTLARSAQAYQNQAQQLANSNAEKAAVIATLQARPSNESMQQLRKTLNDEQVKNADLTRKLQNLELKMLSIEDSKEVVE